MSQQQGNTHTLLSDAAHGEQIQPDRKQEVQGSERPVRNVLNNPGTYSHLLTISFKNPCFHFLIASTEESAHTEIQTHIIYPHSLNEIMLK